MSFSAATRNRESTLDARIEREAAITEWARQAVIAYRNRDNWPQAEARAALDLSIAHLARLLRV